MHGLSFYPVEMKNNWIPLLNKIQMDKKGPFEYAAPLRPGTQELKAKAAQPTRRVARRYKSAIRRPLIPATLTFPPLGFKPLFFSFFILLGSSRASGLEHWKIAKGVALTFYNPYRLLLCLFFLSQYTYIAKYRLFQTSTGYRSLARYSNKPWLAMALSGAQIKTKRP